MDKNVSNEEKDLSLKNIDNYKKSIEFINSDIIKVYNSIINNCLKHAKDNLSITNKNYLIYLLKNCIFILNEVFILILINTNNLEMVVQYSQKAFFYYIEFMGQIGDNNHSFLKLSSNDAKIFVYKKTIYDLIRQINTNDNNKYKELKNRIDLMNIVIYSYLNNINSIEEIDFLDELNNLCDNVNENYNASLKYIIEYFNNEVSSIINNNTENIDYNDIILIQKRLITKLVKKNNINLELIIKKIQGLFLLSCFNYDTWNTKLLTKI